MNLNPLHDRVVVQTIKADTQTSGGIIIPDNATEKANQGTVIAVGAGRRTKEGTIIPLTVQVNDRVLFAANAGQVVKVHGEEVLVLREDEIIAVID